MGPGNSLDVSVTFPSFKFPSRFRSVSVTFPSTFPSRFRRVSAGFPSTFPSKWAAEQTQNQKPVSAQWFRPRLWTRGLGVDPGGRRFRNMSTEMLPVASESGHQMRRGPKGPPDPDVFQLFRPRFRGVSVSVSATFPSTFPSRSRQRFRCVSVGQACARRNLPRNSPNVSGAH